MQVSAVLAIKESSRGLIIEVARGLEPYYTDINAAWREKLQGEFHLDERAVAALERLSLSTGCWYFSHADFGGFFENLTYFGTRLAKLQLDTRLVARALELYQVLCEPYVRGVMGERQREAMAALETLSSATFVTVSGAYFDSKTSESTALLAVLDAELSAGSVSALLERVLQITTANFDATLGLILLRDAESDMLRVEAAVGLKDELDGLAVPVGSGFSGWIAQTGEPAVILDASGDERVQSSVLRSRAKSLWGVPLKTETATIGVLVIGFDKPYEWLPTERELMRAIAHRSALAIDRARITEALREREARIAELSAYLLQAQEEERKRISRELHDETGQALMVIRLYLGMLEPVTTGRDARGKIRETLAVVDRTIEGIRRIIGKLSPLVLQELGLVAAIRKEAKDLARTARVKARVAISDSVGRLAPETEAAIYRVVQEALHNVAKHAQAHAVNILMTRRDGAIRLLVEDDGVGMSARNSSRGHSFGLAGIKERVSMLGGELRVSSAKGKGTRLEVTVPEAGAPATERAQAAAQGRLHA